MMKIIQQTIMVLLLSICAAIPLQGQRMLPGQTGIEAGSGLIPSKGPKSGYFLNAGIAFYGHNGNYKLISGSYNKSYKRYQNILIPVEKYLLEGGFSFHLLADPQRLINLNFALTAALGYEQINKGNIHLFDGAELIDAENFIYGGGGRLSLEIYMSDHLVLLSYGKTRVLLSKSAKEIEPLLGFGVRYQF